MMPDVNYVIYGCSSARTTPGVSLYRSLTLEENIVAVITQDRLIKTIWKGKLKAKPCVLVDYSYWPKFFNILAIGQKYFSFDYQFFHGKQFFSWLGRFMYKLGQHLFIYHSW